MKAIVRKIYDFLSRPFTEDFIYIFLVTILVSTPWIFAQNGIKYLIWQASHSYLLGYAAILITSCFPQPYRKYFKISVFALAFIDYICEISCWITCKSCFYQDMVAIIMGTNFNEGAEFISTYFSIRVLFLIIFAAIICLLFLKYRSIIDKIGKKVAAIVFCCTCIAFVYIIGVKSESWECKFYNKIYAFMSYELPPDLRQYEETLDMLVSEKLPDNVVLILGESFSKSHSSLYGYHVKTNPRLEELVKDSSLIVFDNALSPATTTIPCIQSIMSSYNLESPDTVKWYECVTLPNMMKTAGYKTIWISNQSPTGVYDNTAARYAELCDTTVWIGSKFEGIAKNDYDCALIDAVESINLKSGNNFIIIHMMGSHCNFKDRYPAEWEIFHENEYLMLGSQQRKMIASYDNSILYNDYVVSEILTCLADSESIAFYFPDHGLDVYESTNDYCGHAIQDSPLSKEFANKIPFLVYCSPIFSKEYNDKFLMLRDNSGLEFCTSEVEDVIMDCIGAQLIN